ncbi:MAG: hypothetical protein ACKVJ4_06250 [Flavobacteriales bacterium]|jgi:hypothetical protein|tara:strand:+ start:25181 stop:25504 length:324 start_codon:yes stop_codon:yes gene_type:complete
MKKTIYTLLFFLSISLNINAQSQNSSIDDVKRLNYDLLQEIGFDDSKITLVSRLIYSNAKKATYISEKGVFPNKEVLDNEFKTMFLRFLSEEDFTKFKTIKHKIKYN